MKSITFVTGNKHKLEDAKKLLSGIELVQADIEVPEIQSLDIDEISRQKLQFAYAKIGQPCFVMDTALSFTALGGFPGPLIKWMTSAVGEEKIAKIINTFEDKSAEFTTVLGYFDGQDEHFLRESVLGSVPGKPAGNNGFHWDNIFIPQGETRTFAEMTFEEKQRYAVTSKLMSRFRDLLLLA